MTVDRRIWKSGALAVAVTVGFAVFAFRAAESGGGGSGTGGSGGSGTQITKIVPHVVAGSVDNGISKYLTFIQIVNTGSASINVSASFFNANGAPSTLPIANESSNTTFAGTLPPTALAANSVLVFRAGGDSTALVTNWARIVTTGSASVSAYFELRDGTTNVLYNRVGVSSSAADMAGFVIPRVSNLARGLDVGFALVNTGSAAANLTGTLKSSSGEVLGTRVITLARESHTAVFAREFFSPLSEPSDTRHSFIVFSSNSPQFAAVALAIEGASLSSFPVERLQ